LKFFDRCTGTTTELPGPKAYTPPGYNIVIPTDHWSVSIPTGVSPCARRGRAAAGGRGLGAADAGRRLPAPKRITPDARRGARPSGPHKGAALRRPPDFHHG
jgi:hypothetical protein